MPDPARVAALYDRKAQEYDAHYQRPTDLAEDRVLYGWLRELTDRKRVLDVGCGTAAAIQYISPWWYTGVDISPQMLRRAQDRIDAIKGRRNRYELEPPMNWCGDQAIHRARHAGLADDFDVAFSLWSFPHFPDPARALMRMAEAVKNGGHVMVQGFAQRYAERPNYILNGAGHDLLEPTTPDYLHGMMEGAGLKIVKRHGFRFLMDKPWMERMPVGLLAGSMRVASATMPDQWAATHVLIGRKDWRGR